MVDARLAISLRHFARDRKGPSGWALPATTEEVTKTVEDTARGDPILVRSAARLNGIRVFGITPTIIVKIFEEVIGGHKYYLLNRFNTDSG